MLVFVKLAVALTTLLSLAASLIAATVVPPGPLLGTQVWTSANSPYLISGDVTVGNSGRIFIQEGVEVLFSSTDSAAAGYDPARCEFRVLSGLLVVNGSKTNPVVFRAMSNAAPMAWYGITVTNGLGAFITNAWIQDAYTGLRSDNTNLTVLDHVTLCSNRWGAALGQGLSTHIYPGILNALRVFQNTNGLILGTLSSTRVNNCLIYSNLVRGVAVSSSVDFINDTFHANGIGVDAGGFSGLTSRLLNCIFSSNSIALACGAPDGGSVPFGFVMEPRHCAFWGNAVNLFDPSPPYFNLSTGQNAVFGNPLYANPLGPDGLAGTADDDFTLSAGSACIDAGSNTNAFGLSVDFLGNPRRVDDPLTPDAALYTNTPPVVDIGAYEYQPPLRILSVRYEPETVSLAVPTVPGGQYQLLSTPDFLQWTNVVGGDFVGDGLVQTQTLSTAASPFLFYRVQRAP